MNTRSKLNKLSSTLALVDIYELIKDWPTDTLEKLHSAVHTALIEKDLETNSKQEDI